VKAGLVALVGRPNAGKSTLLNRFAGQTLAIVSDTPQTTRHRIVGVRNVPGGQLVLLDTPGLHKPLYRMNRRMMHTAADALREADVGVLVADATERPGAGQTFALELVRQAGVPVILALNKIDRVHKPRLLPVIDRYARAVDFRAIVPVSALTGDGVSALEAQILAALPEGEPLYPEQYLTDQTERSLAAELIREKVLRHTRDELPYTTAVVIDRFEEPADASAPTRIFASILVDQASQKPIVVGRGGAMIKRIGSEARRDLEGMLGGRVFLDLHVKVREDWRDDGGLLDDMGIRET
jgi:GTPase